MASTPKKTVVKPAANMMAPSKKLTPKMRAAQKALAEREGKSTTGVASTTKKPTKAAASKSTASKSTRKSAPRKAASSKAQATKTSTKPSTAKKPSGSKSVSKSAASANKAATKSTRKIPKAKAPIEEVKSASVPKGAAARQIKSAKAPIEDVKEASSVVESAAPVETAAAKAAAAAVSGYGSGGVETVISVDEVTRQVAAIAEEVSTDALDALVGGDPYVTIENLHAGYGKMEILHNVNLRVGRKQSLCLIGPNGAGKSTILHAIFGFNNIFSGSIKIGDGAEKSDVTKLSPNEKLSQAGIAYILQDKSVFPGMTVVENLWMGGFLKNQPAQAKQAAEMIFDKYPRLAARRKHQAKVLSGGERRLLEISRALVMDPEVLLVDEPSIGLEPRFIDMVFEILHGLQHDDGKTIIMVEQNAKKGLEFADIGYVLVSGEVAIAGKGDDLLANPKVGRLFLGG